MPLLEPMLLLTLWEEAFVPALEFEEPVNFILVICLGSTSI